MSTPNANKVRNNMLTKDAINHFGSVKKLAQVLDVFPQTIYRWKKYVPKGSAWQLHAITDGKLSAEKEDEV